MEKIPTAEEFIRARWAEDKTDMWDNVEAAQEFAKIHVKAALEAAAKDAKVDFVGLESSGYEEVNKDSILNAYPLENIK